jgi:hypothetical protein
MDIPKLPTNDHIAAVRFNADWQATWETWALLFSLKLDLGFSISNDGCERRIAPKALQKFKA